jgi:hypothetical protein
MEISTAPVDLVGPDHRAEPATDPNKAFWRTVLQVGPAALLGIVGILPEVIQVTIDGFGQHLPEGFRVWMLASAVTLTAFSATAARIMALPRVLELTRKYAPFFSTRSGKVNEHVSYKG